MIVVDRAAARSCYNCIQDTYQAQAENLAFQILGDRALAEDATQDAFLLAYKGFGGFRGANLRAWLLRIVANRCRDVVRSNKSRPTISLDYRPDHGGAGLGPAIDVPSGDESPEEHALRGELGAVIQRGLQSLAEERRLAVSLVDVQGFSYEETGQIMGCNVGTVKSRLARGRANMRDYLEQHQELLPDRFRRTYTG